MWAARGGRSSWSAAALPRSWPPRRPRGKVGLWSSWRRLGPRRSNTRADLESRRENLCEDLLAQNRRTARLDRLEVGNGQLLHGARQRCVLQRGSLRLTVCHQPLEDIHNCTALDRVAVGRAQDDPAKARDGIGRVAWLVDD